MNITIDKKVKGGASGPPFQNPGSKAVRCCFDRRASKFTHRDWALLSVRGIVCEEKSLVSSLAHTPFESEYQQKYEGGR